MLSGLFCVKYLLSRSSVFGRVKVGLRDPSVSFDRMVLMMTWHKNGSFLIFSLHSLLFYSITHFS